MLAVFYSVKHCPRFQQLFAVNRRSPLVQEYAENIDKEVVDYLKQHTGLLFENVFEDFVFLYDILEIESKQNHLPLPDWTTKVFPHPLKELTDFVFTNVMTPNIGMRRLRGGPWVKEMVQHLIDYSQSALVPMNRKVFMYSAHDGTVSAVLSALDVFNGIRPPFGAMVFVELHEIINPHHFYVKVSLYNIWIINTQQLLYVLIPWDRAGAVQERIRYLS